MLRFELVPITTTTPPESPPLLHLSFNQSHTCFVAGTDRGYRIYNCDPFRRKIDRDVTGGVSIVEMLLRSHIWAFVGNTPPYSPNKVMIWNDLQSRCVGELLLRSQVRAVRLRIDRIVAVLEHKLKIHNLEDLKLLDEIETISNPKGLCAVSHQDGSMVLACPGLHKGQIRVVHYRSNRTIFVTAHDSGIACFALSPDGKFLATASTKGTLIRVFSTIDGFLLQEVRRGKEKAYIYSLAFSPNGRWLAVSSDRGTVHVFRLKIDKSRSTSETNSAEILSSSSISFFRGMLPKYFSSERSVAKFHLHEGSKHIVDFGPQKNTVLVLGMDGSFYRCRFDPEIGGEMIQLERHNIFKPQ